MVLGFWCCLVIVQFPGWVVVSWFLASGLVYEVRGFGVVRWWFRSTCVFAVLLLCLVELAGFGCCSGL